MKFIMSMIRFVMSMFSLAVIVLYAGAASGQDYPNKPIRILAAEVGGGADFLARLIAQGITGNLHQQVIVDNRPGSVVIPAGVVAKALPDGYTLVLYSNALWIQPFLQTVTYDPVRDFSPITLAVSAPNLIVVHPSLPANSVKQLIDLAKGKPGELNYSGAATGSASNLAAELFKYMAAVKIVYVPYKGSGPALNAALAAEVTLMFATTPLATSHVKSGRLRALAVTSAQPSVLAPGVPTVAETVPGYESTLKYSIFAPAKTPAMIIDRLNTEIVRFIKTTEAKEQFLKAGAEAVGTSSAELAAWIKADMAMMGKVIKDAGIRAE